MWYVNLIRDKRLNLDKGSPSSNLRLDYLIDTVSLKHQDQHERTDGQTPRKSSRRGQFL